jgi:putative tryptophan/tyrosine transport system substrate-binding protein
VIRFSIADFRLSISRTRSKKVICFGLASLLLALCDRVEAQQQAKVPKIGWLGSRPRADVAASEKDLFPVMLRELGYIEGKNITIEYRNADYELNRLPALADELVRLQVDILIAPSTAEGLAAKNATSTIPILFLGGGDPVAAGLVNNLARPGKNITGLTNIAPDLAGKRLELLKETVPKLSHVAVLRDPQGPSSVLQWKESQLPARDLGLQLHSMEIRSVNNIESAFKEAIKAGSAAIAVTSSPFINAYRKRITDLAARNQLPAIYNRKDFVESGGLMSYGPDPSDLIRRAAIYVDKILKGAKPADLPIEQPTKFELVINLKTARQIGLTIPPHVLARADRVIR